MDPDEVLRSLMTMLAEPVEGIVGQDCLADDKEKLAEHTEAVLEALRTLTDWIESGGFLPKVTITNKPTITIG